MNSEPSDRPRVVRVPQDAATDLITVPGSVFDFRFISAPSLDARLAQSGSEDYLVIKEDGTRIAFALCDGVGQSFYGGLAARLLGEALIDWFWGHIPTLEPSQRVLEEWIEVRLTELAQQAAEIIESHPLPADAPPMVADVLERKRQLGAESMFVAGSLDLAASSDSGFILSWMGNSVAEVWTRSEHWISRQAEPANSNCRWSSVVGPKNGRPAVYLTESITVQRVLAYSDGMNGLSAAFQKALREWNADWQRREDRLAEEPPEDDIALVDIRVHTEAYERQQRSDEAPRGERGARVRVWVSKAKDLARSTLGRAKRRVFRFTRD